MDSPDDAPVLESVHAASDAAAMPQEDALAALDAAQRVVDRAMHRRVVPIGFLALVLLSAAGLLWYLSNVLGSPVLLVLGSSLGGAGLFVSVMLPVAFLLHRAEAARYRRCFARLRSAPESVSAANLTEECKTVEEDEADVTTRSYFLTVRTTGKEHKLNVTRQDREALVRAVERLTGRKVIADAGPS